MSASSLLNIGSSALAASYQQLHTVGHNIANVDTPGYSRQEVILQTQGGQYTGAGFYGRGVDVETVRRSYDQFLTQEVQMATATQGAESARATQLQRLNQIFPLGDGGVGAAADNFFASLSDLANRPGDLATRQAVLARADELSARVSQVDSQLQTLDQSVAQNIALSVAKVNDLAKQIASLNNRIAATAGQSHSPNDLLDQREALIADLNQVVKTTSVKADDGSINLFIGGGQALVLSGNASALTLQRDPYDSTISRLAIQNGSSTLALNESALGGGELAGLTRFRDTDLTAARNLLGRIATVVADTVNGQLALGVDKTGTQGAPLFGIGSTQTLPRNTNTGSGVLQAAITDPTALQASDYSVAFDGTNYTITRLSDGNVSTAGALPATVDGVQLSLASGTVAAGDQFLVRPTRYAAQDMKVVLTSPAQLAAASPVVAETGATNTGSGSIGSLGVNSWDPNLTQTVTLTFTGTGTTFDVNGIGTGNPTGVAYTPGGTISFNGWDLKLNGAPKPGDTFVVRLNPTPAANNGNALALGGLRSQPLIDGDTVSNAYGSLLADVGVRVRGSTASADSAGRILTDAQQAQSEVSGVNLDEEAAKMIQFQQAYQAAAKVIATAQTIFDTLLSVVDH